MLTKQLKFWTRNIISKNSKKSIQKYVDETTRVLNEEHYTKYSKKSIQKGVDEITRVLNEEHYIQKLYCMKTNGCCVKIKTFKVLSSFRTKKEECW